MIMNVLIRRAAALTALALAASLTASHEASHAASPATGERTPEPTATPAVTPTVSPAVDDQQQADTEETNQILVRAAEPPLFGDTAEDPSAQRPAASWELRHRLASVNWKVLRPLCDVDRTGRPDAVTLNLFPEVSVVAEADHVGRTDRSDSLRWRGEVRNSPDSSVTLTAIGLCDSDPEKVSLAGSVKFNGEEYTIRPKSGGRVIITEIDSTASGLLQKPDEGTSGKPAGSIAKGRPAARNHPKNRMVRTGPAATGNAVIDALILYTPGAAKEAGGTEEIEAWIQDAVSRANDNLSESGVKAEFRVVDVRKAAGYTGKETVVPAFNALTNTHDGQLDDAVSLREAYGADIVTTVVRGYDPKTMIAGLASYPENPRSSATSDQIWSVVAANQLWAYILAHEWGHLLGLDHDWTTSPEQGTAFPDNHGYVAPDGSFTTIMGYPSACSPRPCPYTDYYANPRLAVNGKPLGVAIGRGPQPADNTRVMNLTAPQVAGYRSPRGSSPDMDLKISVPGGGGTAATEVSGPFSSGDSVTVVADPAPGRVFDGWTLDGKAAGKANPLNLTMSRDHSLVARFAKGAEARYQFNQVTIPDHGGGIALSPPGAVYTTGTRVLATAKPREGYEFSGWELDGSPAGDDDKLLIETSRAHTLVARFARSVMLTVRPMPSSGGKVTLSEDGTNAYGEDVIANAIPAPGYVFGHWDLDGRRTGTDPVTSVTVNGNQTLTAFFTKPAVKKPIAKPKPKPKKKPVKKVKKAKKKPKKKKRSRR